MLPTQKCDSKHKMAVCRKSYAELAIALVLLILTVGTLVMNVTGTYWKDDEIVKGGVTGDTFNIIANILNVFSGFATIAILFKAVPVEPVVSYVLMFLILLGMVIDLYFTMFAEVSATGDAFGYIVLGFNAIPRLIGILLGYGICSIPDAIEAAKILGGKRRFR